MRFRSFKTIEKQLDILFSNISISKVGLVSPEASDYPDLEYLLDYLKHKDKGISFASLRVDRLSEKMIESLVHGGRYSITIAPETGTDRLRSSCGKSFTNKTIIEKLLLAVSYGVTQVKLYFMIGLPGETEEDVVAISELCKNIIEITRQNLVVSIGPFIPKPGTRWQSETFISISSIRKKYKTISSEFRKIKKPVQLRFTSPKEALQEYNLTWYSCNDSIELISSVEKDLPIKKHFSREDTIKELETLW